MTRKLAAFVLVASLLVLTGAAPTAAETAEARTLEGPHALRRRLAVFGQVWTEIRDRYWDPGFNGVDWESVGRRYRPQVAAAASESAFLDLLRAMTGELRDAHTRILSAQELNDRRQEQTMSAGVILFEVEGRPVVFDVRSGSAAAEAGLRPGMLVLAVDGVPVAEALARARAEVGPSSSERAALVLAYLRLIRGPAAEPLRLDLAAPDGTRRSLGLARRALDAAPQFEARRLEQGPLYVRFDRFRRPVARLLRDALRAHRDAPGLILDLRSNTGGDGREGIRAVAPLLAAPTVVARLRTRTGRPPTALLGLARLPLELVAGEEGGQLFAGPVLILTNAGTGSTSEVIAASLQERGRARIVGSRSCGCALGVLRRRRLATGGALAISEVGLVTGLGRRVEGAGVTPDLPVDLTLEDLRLGRDRVLEAAVADLLRQRAITRELGS